VRSTSGFLPKATAEQILAGVDESGLWSELLNATIVTAVAIVGGEDGAREEITVPDRKIRLEALKYLTDRRDGKAPQGLHLHGDKEKPVHIVVEHIGKSAHGQASA